MSLKQLLCLRFSRIPDRACLGMTIQQPKFAKLVQAITETTRMYPSGFRTSVLVIRPRLIDFLIDTLSILMDVDR